MSAVPVQAAERVLVPKLHHLRITPQREWDDFPAQAEATRLTCSFAAERNTREWCLHLRQQDVRQTWKVLLNTKELGRLPPDENDMVVYFSISPGWLNPTDNKLVIEQAGKVADDVRIGEVILDDRPVKESLSEATVDLSVLDASNPDKPVATPCRITVLNAAGALMSAGASSNDHLAVRPGVIYSGTGKARFGLPAGEYTIYASRGLEYGLDSVRIKLRPGDVVARKLVIRREVPTRGWVSCDTHIHTLTYSGHGDAAVEEQVLAIAGEGIELPIATEHNRHIDYSRAAVKQQVRRYFTPVVGNEVTTAFGHFNIFPVRPETPIPDFQLKDWKSTHASIAARTGARVIILNHPRDRHSGFRPFGPERHISISGEDMDGWNLPANGLEVINSGALKSDFMAPFHDWFGLLNRGRFVTPVAASDSHDVARYFVGQGRTYIRCPDDDPGNIDVEKAVTSLVEGRVMVSCGLLTEITVNERYGPGDLVPPAEQVKVHVRVLGPSWVQADKVELYANGRKIREAKISGTSGSGILWVGDWLVPRFRHDVHLTAITSGPGVRELYWPIPRPYQATSTHVERRVVGASGAVWIDADGDGKRTSAREYARRLLKNSKNPAGMTVSLRDYDEAVAVQAIGLLRARGVSLQDEAIRGAARIAGKHVERAFQRYFDAWRETVRSGSP